MASKRADTSWGKVATWYDEHLKTCDDTYQKQLILPNILRVLDLHEGENVLDLACGQGFFARAFNKTGARVTGCDISKELIAIAQAQSDEKITYVTAQADQLSFSKSSSFDTVVCILALQNIENILSTYKEVSRVLVFGGRFVIVINHPAFRVPKNSSWGWDDEKNVQFRRVDRYLSADSVPIHVHPGLQDPVATISYHRSLQDFFKVSAKVGFAVTRLEEWISHKKSTLGPRQKAEDTARKEIPLFLMLEARKEK